MPAECSNNIDLVHMDKGKVVTIGNYPKPNKEGKNKDYFCLEMRYANFPYETTVVKIDNSDNSIGQFTVDHHWHKIKTAKPLRAASLPLIYGTRFDVAFKEAGECRFVDDDPDYPLKKPVKKNTRWKPEAFGTYNVIQCKGKPYDEGTEISKDKAKIIDRASRKAKKRGKSKSTLNEFLEAHEYPESNNQQIQFGEKGGKITFTPFYFTEQWAFLRTSRQLKTKKPYPSVHGKRIHRDLPTQVKRISREINFLMGVDEFSERSTLADIEGVGAMVDGELVGDDPNTYAITKAFIDPVAIDSVVMKSPRYGKARKSEVNIKPHTNCEIRTNFKGGRLDERVIVCTQLNGEQIDEKVRKLRT